MKTKFEILQDENADLIIAFHIGRGGHFNNAGHLTFIGERDINEFTDKLFLNEDETEYTTDGGESVGLDVDNDGTGAIDIDGGYDTTYCKKASDLNEDEFNAIKKVTQGYCGSFHEKVKDIADFYEPEKLVYFILFAAEVGRNHFVNSSARGTESEDLAISFESIENAERYAHENNIVNYWIQDSNKKIY